MGTVRPGGYFDNYCNYCVIVVTASRGFQNFDIDICFLVVMLVIFIPSFPIPIDL